MLDNEKIKIASSKRKDNSEQKLKRKVSKFMKRALEHTLLARVPRKTNAYEIS